MWKSFVNSFNYHNTNFKTYLYINNKDPLFLEEIKGLTHDYSRVELVTEHGNLYLNTIKQFANTLTYLDITNTGVTDLSVLADFKNLTTLIMINTQIADVSVLLNLPNFGLISVEGSLAAKKPCPFAADSQNCLRWPSN